MTVTILPLFKRIVAGGSPGRGTRRQRPGGLLSAPGSEQQVGRPQSSPEQTIRSCRNGLVFQPPLTKGGSTGVKRKHASCQASMCMETGDCAALCHLLISVSAGELNALLQWDPSHLLTLSLKQSFLTGGQGADNGHGHFV